MLTSTCDTSNLKLRGVTHGTVGDSAQMMLHTYDHRARKRATGGDLFTCALRNHGALPEDPTQDPAFLTVEQPAIDLGNGTHILSYAQSPALSLAISLA